MHTFAVRNKFAPHVKAMLLYTHMARTTKPSPKYDPTIEGTPAYKAGTYSTLTPELCVRILTDVKNGKINQEIIDGLGIPQDTFYSWLARNTLELKDKIANARRDYLLDLAEEKLTKLGNSKNERIQLQAIIFLAERLGKKWYANKEQHELLQDDEGKQLEPENKERLDKLLGKQSIVSPLQLDNKD